MLIKLDRYWLSTVSLAWPRETAGVGRLVDGRSVAGWSLRAAGGRGGACRMASWLIVAAK